MLQHSPQMNPCCYKRHDVSKPSSCISAYFSPIDLLPSQVPNHYMMSECSLYLFCVGSR